MSQRTVVTVVGARPQFIKLGPVSRALRARGLREFVVHTGQHYDFSMSQSFFEELDLPEPDLNLGVSSPGPARQLGEMVPGLSDAFARVRPELVLVFGDTTSTIAATLSASYAGIPVGHVEAGMRSFVPDMPEEIARVVTDRLSQLWFTASHAANDNLEREGLGPGEFVGDTMLDVVRGILARLEDPSEIESRYGVRRGDYVLATLHRANNTDDPARLEAILDGLARLSCPVLFPVHPRTRAALEGFGLEAKLSAGRIHAVAPIRYLETMLLARHARRVFTDSGGLQKEALYLSVPCSTMRDETEWVETVTSGWNVLVGADAERIASSLEDLPRGDQPPEMYGDGRSGELIAEAVQRFLNSKEA